MFSNQEVQVIDLYFFAEIPANGPLLSDRFKSQGRLFDFSLDTSWLNDN